MTTLDRKSTDTSHTADDSGESGNAASPNPTLGTDTLGPDEFAHLDPRVKPFMSASTAVRIQRVLSDVLVLHPVLCGLINEVEWLIHEPPRQRARGLLISGEPGSGKTALAELIQKKYPITQPGGSTDPHKRPRVVAVSLSGARRTKAILNRILEGTQAPIARQLTIGDQEVIVIDTLRRMQCRLLILDEAQDLCKIPEREQIRVLEVIKYLMNTLRMPVLAFGTSLAKSAFRTDPHLQARFGMLELPLWEAGDDFSNFLASLERCLPLKHPSGLSSQAMQKALIKATSGVLDQVLTRIRIAAVNAIASGEERITVDSISNEICRPSVDLLRTE